MERAVAGKKQHDGKYHKAPIEDTRERLSVLLPRGMSLNDRAPQPGKPGAEKTGDKEDEEEKQEDPLIAFYSHDVGLRLFILLDCTG